jgi:hypothetical protein
MSAETPTSLDQVRDQSIQLTTGMASAVVTIFSILVRDLDAAGITSKDSLADQLERAAAEAQENRAPEQGTTDLVVFRRLANALRTPLQTSGGGAWDAAAWGP